MGFRVKAQFPWGFRGLGLGVEFGFLRNSWGLIRGLGLSVELGFLRSLVALRVSGVSKGFLGRVVGERGGWARILHHQGLSWRGHALFQVPATCVYTTSSP